MNNIKVGVNDSFLYRYKNKLNFNETFYGIYGYTAIPYDDFDTKHIKLTMNIKDIKYYSHGCPLFGIYIIDGDINKRLNYSYVMGPYCGQTNDNDSSTIDFQFTSTTDNLTIVVYVFANYQNPSLSWEVKYIALQEYISATNPCSTLGFFCNSNSPTAVR